MSLNHLTQGKEALYISANVGEWNTTKTTISDQLELGTTLKLVDTVLVDKFDNELITHEAAALGVNHLNIKNGDTTQPVVVGVAGDDTNIDLKLEPKNTGSIDVSSARITNLAEPINLTDAITKNYEDARHSHGSMCVIDNLTLTNIALAATPVPVVGVTIGIDQDGFTHTSPGRLTYDNPTPFVMHTTASYSVKPAAINNTYAFYFAKNGTVIPNSVNYITPLLTTTLVSVPMNFVIPMVQGDYIEVWVANTLLTNDITITNAHMVINVL